MVGLTIYTLGLHESIGEFLWKYINVPVMPFLKKKQSEEIIVSGINQSYKKKFKKTDKK